MKVTIQMDGVEKEIEMKEMKGKHMKKIWSFLKGLYAEDPTMVEEYVNYVDALTVELSGLTQEQLDELNLEDKEKLNSAIVDRAFQSISFMMPSQMRANSTQKVA